MSSAISPFGKSLSSLFCSIAITTTVFLSQGGTCFAAAHGATTPSPIITSTERNSLIDPTEEARNIKRLVKLALDPKASETVKKALADEIAFVERNHKLKDAVVFRLLQEDDAYSDPSLPKVQRINYKDGNLRGLLFVQSDVPASGKPAKLAWTLDSKKDKKEAAKQ